MAHRFTTILLVSPLLLFIRFHQCQSLNFGMMMKKRGADNHQPTTTMDDNSSTSTCDAMLIKSLDQVNDAKAVSQKERDEALAAHAASITELANLRGELQKTTDTFTSRVESLEDQLAEAQREHESAIQSMEDAQARRLEEVAGQHSKELQETTDSFTAQLKQLENKLVDLQKDKDSTVKAMKQTEAARLEELAFEHKKELDEKDEIIRTIEAKSKEAMEQLREENNNKLVSASNEAQAALTAANEEHAAALAKLKSEMEQMRAKADSEVQGAMTKLAEREKELEADAARKFAEVESKHDKMVKDLKTSVAELEKIIGTWQEKYNELQAKNQKASEDLARFEAQFASRSYCNLTFIQEDAYNAASVAQEKVKRNVAIAADQASKAARKATEQAYVAAGPHLTMTRELYDQNLKAHVDHHVLPVYEQYLSPLVQKAAIYLKQAFATLKDWGSATHRALVKFYRSDCPKARQKLEKINAPKYVLDHVKESCRNPEQAVDRYLWIALMIFVLVFRSFIWRLLWRIVLLPFKIVWFFCPLRFFMKSSSRQEDKDEQGASSRVKVVPVKSSPSQ